MSHCLTLRLCAQAKHVFETEEVRVRRYLDPGTWARVCDIMTKELLVKPQSDVLGGPRTGIVAMITEDRNDDLALAFRMYRNIDAALDYAAFVMKKHVVANVCLPYPLCCVV